MEEGPSKKETVPMVLTILKVVWGQNVLYCPGFGDLQLYETCFRGVSGFLPDSIRLTRKCLTVLRAPPDYFVAQSEELKRAVPVSAENTGPVFQKRSSPS